MNFSFRLWMKCSSQIQQFSHKKILPQILLAKSLFLWKWEKNTRRENSQTKASNQCEDSTLTEYIRIFDFISVFMQYEPNIQKNVNFFRSGWTEMNAKKWIWAREFVHFGSLSYFVSCIRIRFRCIVEYSSE